MSGTFDTSKADSQGTAVRPVSPADFDSAAYADYTADLEPRCLDFMNRDEGVLVYRRLRVPEVFSYGCRDGDVSLALQLGALQRSMAYAADIPNFLEPWYGIGLVSSAFGVEYLWHEGQAPAVEAPFRSCREALDGCRGPIEESPVGVEVIDRIARYLELTDGRVPMSFTDNQSPLNVASSYLLDASSFMFELFDHPEDARELLDSLAGLIGDFLVRQSDIIGDALVRPGHGFASARSFAGVGFSDDNFLLISDDMYADFARDALIRAAGPVGPPVFHSCGNWSGRASSVLAIPDLAIADGAVGAETDPDPNIPEVLGESFAGSGTVLHVRIVGSADTVIESVKRIWRPGLKLIVTTYCETPEEQQQAYDRIHSICS